MSGTTDTSAASRLSEWGTIIVSIYGLTMVLVALVLVFVKNDTATMQLLVGAIISIGNLVAGYWLGSSRGSAKKDEAIATMQTKSPAP